MRAIIETYVITLIKAKSQEAIEHLKVNVFSYPVVFVSIYLSPENKWGIYRSNRYRP